MVTVCSSYGRLNGMRSAQLASSLGRRLQSGLCHQPATEEETLMHGSSVVSDFLSNFFFASKKREAFFYSKFFNGQLVQVNKTFPVATCVHSTIVCHTTSQLIRRIFRRNDQIG